MDLSIFVMYSSDRKSQLEQMIAINSKINGWNEADKILLVDGESNIYPEGFRVIQVPRNNNDFIWSDMWEAGVNASTHDVVWYLDSDRIVPRNTIKLIEENIRDNRFLFTDSLFNLTKPVETEFLIDLVDNYPLEKMFAEIDTFNGLISFEPKFKLPLHGPGKNCMSGCVAFLKQDFKKSRGVDRWFKGAGAYADTDYAKQCWEMGFEFVELGVPEFHIWHTKLSNDGNKELTMYDIEKLSLDNFIYHANKWNLGFKYCKAIAAYLKLDKNYVEKTLESFR